MKLEEYLLENKKNYTLTGSYLLHYNDPSMSFQDIDYIVRINDIDPKIINNNDKKDCKEYGFLSIKTKEYNSGNIYNFLLLHDEDYDEWIYATNKMLEFFRSSNENKDKMIDKQFRVGFFEACRFVFKSKNK